MKRTTTTATRKTTTKAKTATTPADATGAKLGTLQSEPATWKQAIRDCIRMYDTDEKLREKLQRQYDRILLQNRTGFWVDDQRDGYIDPVDKIHPTEVLINKIGNALKEQKRQDTIADDKYKSDLMQARGLETFLEQREAEQAVKYGTENLIKATAILDDTLIETGALALSLRAPCFMYADMMRPSRNSLEEKRLFTQVHLLFFEYPPQARRDAHMAKTKEERMKILTAARIAEGEAMRKKHEEAEAKRKKAQEESAARLKAQSTAVSAWARRQGVSEYVHGDHVTWGGEVWKLSTFRQWELAKLALCNDDKEGKFTASAENEIEHIFGGRTNRDSAKFKFGRHIHKVKGKVFQFMREARKIRELPQSKNNISK